MTPVAATPTPSHPRRFKRAAIAMCLKAARKKIRKKRERERERSGQRANTGLIGGGGSTSVKRGLLLYYAFLFFRGLYSLHSFNRFREEKERKKKQEKQKQKKDTCNAIHVSLLRSYLSTHRPLGGRHNHTASIEQTPLLYCCSAVDRTLSSRFFSLSEDPSL